MNKHSNLVNGAAATPMDSNIRSNNEDVQNSGYSATYKTGSSIPTSAQASVLQPSAPLPDGFMEARGLDFENKPDLQNIIDNFFISGFQATQVGRAVQIVNEMINFNVNNKNKDEGIKQSPLEKMCRNSFKDGDENEITGNDVEGDGGCGDDSSNGVDGTNCGDNNEDSVKQLYYSSTEWHRRDRCTIWLSFTSNMMSSGLREIFVFLAKHKLVDIIVTSAGGVEEDFVKCLGPTAIGEFNFKGEVLRKNGYNRIGNLLVPNENYCKFEDWLQPILDNMLTEQKQKINNIIKNRYKNMLNMNNKNNICENGSKHGENIQDIDIGLHDEDFELISNAVFSPSEIINRLGREINNEKSLFYWCYRNNIPVFCPGLTDGSLGDNLFFHTYRNSGLICDIIKDIRRINDMATRCTRSGLIILGGGLPKHHICNANLMRNGADYAVYINTACEFDGSDSGASPDEAISWGKIKPNAKTAKVCADATIIFPLIVAATFAEKFHNSN